MKASVEHTPTILELQKRADISEAELHNDFEISLLTQTLEKSACSGFASLANLLLYKLTLN